MSAVLSKSGQVDRYFRQQIGSGAWAPGSQIPSDGELCRILGVSAITIKNVMARLAAEGLIVRRQRLGSFVAEPGATGQHRDSGRCQTAGVSGVALLPQFFPIRP